MLTILLNRSRCCALNHGTANDQLQWTRYRGKRSRLKGQGLKSRSSQEQNNIIIDYCNICSELLS